MSGAPTSHARLSASSAHRWLECPGSIKLSEGAPDTTSIYAAEGTFAHSIAADCLDTDVDAVAFLGIVGTVDGFGFTVNQEMVDAVQVYLDAVRAAMAPSNGPTTAKFEVALLAPLSKVDADLGGTADAVVYCPAQEKLHVFDFKYGSGTYVEADSNEQLKLYALGAMLTVNRPIKEVEVVIVQPRFEGAKPVRSWSFRAADIMDFIADIQDAAEKSRLPKPPLKPGDWCKFCKAAKDCPELKKKQDALVSMEFGAVVDYKLLATMLASLPLVKERIKAIEEFAYKEAVSGKEIPGYKLVDKRPVRKWKSEGDVVEWAQKRAIDPYEKPDVKSPAQLEKGLKPAEKKELAELVEKVSSGTVLVSVDDDRPAAKRVSAAEDFAVIDGTATGVKLF